MSKRRRPPCHTDFVGAFTDSAIFTSRDQEFTVKIRPIGEFNVPSGRIIASEPAMIGWPENQKPLSRIVPPGQYPVIVSMANTWPACLKIQFTDQKTIRWEIATREGEDSGQLYEGQYFGYGVDGGTGGFADANAALALVNTVDWFVDVVPEIDRAVENAGNRAGFFEFTMDQLTGANLVGCQSGYGDGAYASYWGVDRNGEITSLVTDFGILVEEVMGTVAFEQIGSMVGDDIQHCALERTGFQNVRVVQHEHARFGFYFEYYGIGTANAKLVNSEGRVIADTAKASLNVRFIDGRRRYQSPLKCTPESIDGAKLVVTFSRGCRALRHRHNTS